MTETILLTGSDGLIGKILSPFLKKNFQVFECDQKLKDKEDYYQVDLSNPKKTRELFHKLPKMDYVIHLAADSNVWADWNSVLRNNIMATQNIFWAAEKYRVKRVIYFSSTHAMGGYEGNPKQLHLEDQPTPISVNAPYRPDGYYGASKACGEILGRMYWEVYGLSVICLRIGAVCRDNDPSYDKRVRKIWLGQQDLCRLVDGSIRTLKPFGIYYGISGKSGAYWDLSETKKDLAYEPKGA